MKTLIFQRIVPHYRSSVFRKLTNLLDAVICHGKEPPEASLEDEGQRFHFPHCQIKNWYFTYKCHTLVMQDVLTPILKYRPGVIVTEFALCILSNWILFLLRPFFGFGLIFWSHGYNRQKGFHPESSWSDRLRIWMINRADGVILYGDRERHTLSKWVKQPEKLFVANNTLDAPSLLAVRDECIGEGVKSIKERWKLNQRYILSYSGRLIKEKRLDLILRTFKVVQHEITHCALIVVGDGTQRSVLNPMASDLEISNVYFLGEINDNRIYLYISADVHSLPFQNASFDVVASYAMLEHICEAESALTEMLRVLGPRGALIIYAPNMLSPFRALGLLGRRILQQKSHPDGTLSYLLRTVSLCAVKACGFHRKFVYRCPVLNCEKFLGSDYDAVFLVNPFDLMRLTKDNGLAVISTSAGGSSRLGKLIAQLLPNLAGGIQFVAKKTL